MKRFHGFGRICAELCLRIRIDLGYALSYSPDSLMRRFLSITLVFALLAATATPLVAASCPHVKMAMACHRTEHAHHCESMQDEPGDASQAEPGEPAFAGVTAAQDCPMDCCAPSQRTSSVAFTASFSMSLLSSSESSISFTSLIFSAPGFSSHTDRGPPAV
jgi:hypothetical protein